MLKVLRWSVVIEPHLKKNLEKKPNFFFPAPQSLISSCWPQNAPCENRVQSNFPKRSLNRHLFLSININSTASWKTISAHSVCKVHFEVYIYTIERFLGKKTIFFLTHPNIYVWGIPWHSDQDLAVISQIFSVTFYMKVLSKNTYPNFFRFLLLFVFMI